MYRVGVRRAALMAASVVCVGFGGVASVVWAQRAGTVANPAAVDVSDVRALELAMVIRERAISSSFEALESFAEDAVQRGDLKALLELQHTINLLIEQNDFDAASSWNAQLGRLADRHSAAHYIELTKINDLIIRRLRDGEGSLLEAEALSARQKHWMPKVMAEKVRARILVDELRSSEAMMVLAKALSYIPTDDRAKHMVSASVWQAVAEVHAGVDDVPGFISSIEVAENYKALAQMPDPDYRALYYMAQSMGAVGRYKEALSTVEIYRELADRHGTPMAQGLAGNVCGLVSTAADDWRAVLTCYAPFGAELNVPDFVRLMMLPRRAAAYARTGQAALARRDLEEIRRLVADGEMRPVLAIERAEAEYLIAIGDYAQGIPRLRNYHLTMQRTATQRTSAMMEQAVLGLDEQLRQVQEQARLKETTIDMQRWLLMFGVLFGLVSGGMFVRQRKLSRELAEINCRQAEAHAKQAEMFTNISHEIRTPLNGVVSMADALAKTDLPPEAAKMARIIASSSNTLERLMSDILDSAKIKAGQVAIEPMPFSLRHALTDVAALWSPRANDKGIRIVTQFGEGADVWVMADRVRLTQVLNNLVSNALKFTEAGKIVISVVVQKDDRYLFAVTDTGVGFDMAKKTQLFRRFEQADSTITRRFGGTGLGLPITRELVELMGGSLDCESEEGRGSQFWFTLHLPRVQTPTALVEPADGLGESTARYLIVDDNATNRTIMGMLLKDESRQLHFAENGQEAVDLAQAIPFDVILMDMQMPVMSGLDAIRAIRAHESRAGSQPATIVILSANADSEHMKAGAEAGADGHIAKPVVLERLMSGIDQAVRKRAGEAVNAA